VLAPLAKLEKALAPYIERGRRVSAARIRRRPSGRGIGQDNAAGRAWAKSEGLQVFERGRISADVMGQYEAAH
jgi:Lsr2